MIVVWVTRDEAPRGPLSEALRENGLEVLHAPVVTRRVIPEALLRLAEVRADDWVVLTSRFGIEAAAGQLAGCDPRVAVVGEDSRRAAEARGLRVALTAPEAHADSLFAELRAATSAGRVWCLQSSLAPARAGWGTVELIHVPLYDTRPRAVEPTVYQRADLVAVTSHSAVEAVGPAHLPFASLGPRTSATVRRLGGHVWVEASRPNLECLAGAIREQVYGSRHHRA